MDFLNDFIFMQNLIPILIETCEHLIQENGNCKLIKCINCPGSSYYNKYKLKCCTNSFSSGEFSKPEDEKIVESSKLFLKYYQNLNYENKKTLRIIKFIKI